LYQSCLNYQEFLNWAETRGFDIEELENDIEDKIEMLPRLLLIGKSVVVHNAGRLCMKKNWIEYTENKKIIWFRNYNPYTAIIQNET
jgi:hypothetical protein